MQTPALSEAILRIYDAAIYPDDWLGALDNISISVGSRATNIVLVDNLDLLSPCQFRWRSDYARALEPAILKNYFNRHANHEEHVWASLPSNSASRLFLYSDLLGDVQSMREEPYYRYMQQHMGIFRRMFSRLNDNKAWHDTIEFKFKSSEKNISDGSIQTANLLLPHIAKSLQMSLTFRRLYERYQAVLGSLDHVNVGLIVLSAQATAIVANKEAQRISELSDGFSISSGGELRCIDQDTQNSICKAIREMAVTAKGENNGHVVEYVLARRSLSRPYLIEISAVRDRLSECERGLAGALLTIIDPENPMSLDVTRLKESYELSDAEHEVCKALTMGYSNREIADRRNVKPDTIKEQVSSIFAKTNTGSRVELMRLVFRCSPPIG